jgi:hypothetical protein
MRFGIVVLGISGALQGVSSLAKRRRFFAAFCIGCQC